MIRRNKKTRYQSSPYAIDLSNTSGEKLFEFFVIEGGLKKKKETRYIFGETLKLPRMFLFVPRFWKRWRWDFFFGAVLAIAYQLRDCLCYYSTHMGKRGGGGGKRSRRVWLQKPVYFNARFQVLDWIDALGLFKDARILVQLEFNFSTSFKKVSLPCILQWFQANIALVFPLFLLLPLSEAAENPFPSPSNTYSKTMKMKWQSITEPTRGEEEKKRGSEMRKVFPSVEISFEYFQDFC